MSSMMALKGFEESLENCTTIAEVDKLHIGILELGFFWLLSYKYKKEWYEHVRRKREEIANAANVRPSGGCTHTNYHYCLDTCERPAD